MMTAMALSGSLKVLIIATKETEIVQDFFSAMIKYLQRVNGTSFLATCVSTSGVPSKWSTTVYMKLYCTVQLEKGSKNYFFSLYVFWRTKSPFFTIFSSVAPHRGQPVAKYHPRRQPTRRWAISCGLGRRRIWTRDCRTTVWRTTIEPPRIPLNYITTTFCTVLRKVLNCVSTLPVRSSGGNMTSPQFSMASCLPATATRSS
jgi:hypothetical protein